MVGDIAAHCVQKVQGYCRVFEVYKDIVFS